MFDQHLHDKHRERVKRRFLEEGVESFTDHQLLELLLFYCIARRDTNPLAHRLINQFGSLTGVLSASYEELLAVEGVGENTAILLRLLSQIFFHYRSLLADTNKRVNDIWELADYLRPFFFGARVEQVYMVCIDDLGRVLCCEHLNEGGANFAHIDTRDMVSVALRYKETTGVVLAHCHPMGNHQPSASDHMTTQQCQKVLCPLGIRLVDHLVFGGDGWSSMAHLGMID